MRSLRNTRDSLFFLGWNKQVLGGYSFQVVQSYFKLISPSLYHFFFHLLNNRLRLLVNKVTNTWKILSLNSFIFQNVEFHRWWRTYFFLQVRILIISISLLFLPSSFVLLIQINFIFIFIPDVCNALKWHQKENHTDGLFGIFGTISLLSIHLASKEASKQICDTIFLNSVIRLIFCICSFILSQIFWFHFKP